MANPLIDSRANTIPIARPMLGQAENEALQSVLASGELAQGRRVADFEEAFSAYCGARFAVATSSGTTALHIALLAHDIGAGDEVITTPFTFVASSNAILYAGACPVFVDIEPDTFNIDPERVERAITPRTKAVLAVDLFGHPADLPPPDRDMPSARARADRGCLSGARRGNRWKQDRQPGYSLLLVLSDQEHDDRRRGDDHHRARRGSAGTRR
jgi:hypothetical protein